jgi:hypothetical protein
MNWLKYLQTRSFIDDAALYAANVTIAISIAYGFTALTSFQIINGNTETAIRTRQEEVQQREEELEASERAKRHPLKKIGKNKYLRLRSPCFTASGDICSRIDTIILAE